jgi:hypothetical protein
MIKTQYIKVSLVESMEHILDPYMAEQGFKRSKKSLQYKRNFPKSTQIINVYLYGRPRDTPSAAAAVYPFMEVLVPDVDKVYRDMLGNSPQLLSGITGGISKQPIGFNSQKQHTGRWFIYDLSSIAFVLEEIKAFIKHWTMPLLDVYTSPEDIIATDERGDGRLLIDNQQTMRVIAAALVCKRKDYAEALLEKRLTSSTGPRKNYLQVFEYVQKST